MRIRNRQLLIASILFVSLVACRYDPDEYQDPDDLNEPEVIDVIDPLRDNVMDFDVYDSSTQLIVGEENWSFIGTRVIAAKYFREFYVNRSYPADNSGGNIAFSEVTSKGGMFKSEYQGQWTPYFIDVTNPKFSPPDTAHKEYRYDAPPNTQKTLSVVCYRGTQPIQLNKNSDWEVYCFRSDRDSTAHPSTSPPYFSKHERYFFNEERGLVFMNERITLHRLDSDSVVSDVYKIRR